MTISKETRTVYDPFLDKTVEVSDKLTDRLRGRYASGPTMADGEPEFGWKEFETPSIQHEAAAEIERLQAKIISLKTLLNKKYDHENKKYDHENTIADHKWFDPECQAKGYQSLVILKKAKNDEN